MGGARTDSNNFLGKLKQQGSSDKKVFPVNCADPKREQVKQREHNSDKTGEKGDLSGAGHCSGGKGFGGAGPGEELGNLRPQGPQTALSGSLFATLGRWGDGDDYDSDDTLWQETGDEQGWEQKKGRQKQKKDKSQCKSDDEYLDSAILLAAQEREEATEGLKVIMGALGFEDDEIQKIIADTDDEGDDSISYEAFQEWLTHKILNRDPDKAFRLSDHPQAGRIPAKHYKKAARELGERMAEAGQDLCAEGPAWDDLAPEGLPPDLRRAGERT